MTENAPHDPRSISPPENIAHCLSWNSQASWMHRKGFKTPMSPVVGRNFTPAPPECPGPPVSFDEELNPYLLPCVALDRIVSKTPTTYNTQLHILGFMQEAVKGRTGNNSIKGKRKPPRRGRLMATASSQITHGMADEMRDKKNGERKS